MSSTALTSITRVTGLLLGVAIAAVVLLGWRVPAGAGPLGADVALMAVPSGEVEVSPAGRFLTATSLSPGSRAARGMLRMRNQTGEKLALRPRALPADRALDRVVWIELTAGDRRLYRGPLGGLRRGTRGTVGLASGARASLTARAWIPRSSRGPWRGRMTDVQVDLLSTSRKRSR